MERDRAFLEFNEGRKPYAYADPPYVNQAKKHYKNQPICAEVNHEVLLGHLCEHYEGWALSCSSTSLKYILSLKTCPDDVRIASWVKPFASFKPNVNPGYCWEPVIFYNPKKRDRYAPTIRDFISANITMQTGLSGAKPDAFCYWIFDLLGLDENDQLCDLFPGTGVVGKCWNRLVKQRQIYNGLPSAVGLNSKNAHADTTL